MARIRSVHPGLFTDDDFIEAGAMARLLFIGIWTESDDQGVFEWKPIRFKMRIFPADDANVPSLLQELSAVNLIMKFSHEGRNYGAVKNFCKWQRPKKPQYLYPCPDEIRDFVGVPRTTEGVAERGTALGRILCEAQHALCFYCSEQITFYRKKSNSLEVDHKIPVSRGGDDELKNLAAACKSCNSLKRNMTVEEFRSKFAISDLVLASRERSTSHTAIEVSHRANGATNGAKAELAPQREDGGDNRKREKQPSTSESGLPREGSDIFQFCEALGVVWRDNPSRVHWPSLLLKAKGDGLDFERHILPAALETRARKKTSIEYALKIAQSNREAEKQAPTASAAAPSEPFEDTDEHGWRNRIRASVKIAIENNVPLERTWSKKWGPILPEAAKLYAEGKAPP